MKRTGKKTNDYVNCCWSKRQKYRFHCNAKGKRVFNFLLILFFEKYFAVVPIVFLHGNCIVTLMRRKKQFTITLWYLLCEIRGRQFVLTTSLLFISKYYYFKRASLTFTNLNIISTNVTSFKVKKPIDSASTAHKKENKIIFT